MYCIDEKSQHLRLEGDESATVTATGSILRQAIVNILHNAIKFSPPHGDISVSTAQTWCAMCRIRIVGQRPGDRRGTSRQGISALLSRRQIAFQRQRRRRSGFVDRAMGRAGSRREDHDLRRNGEPDALFRLIFRVSQCKALTDSSKIRRACLRAPSVRRRAAMDVWSMFTLIESSTQ